jgi:UDP-N-acetylmuramoylalanine--D-glutamate ligase
MYLVAGLGMTGQSVLRYFEAQGDVFLAFDTREGLDIDLLKNQFSGD